MGESSLPCQSAGSFLSVGLSLQINFQPSDSRIQHGSSLLGWREGSWLVCEWPFQLGQPVECSPGATCLIRYVHQGKMIGFRSAVISAHESPFPFLLLSYPAQREEMPLRRHSRVAINEPVLVRTISGANTRRPELPDRIGGLLRDLSAEGCCLSVQRPLQDFFPGMLVRVEFEVMGVGHISSLGGIVRNISPAGAGTEVGLEFRFDGKEAIEYRGWGASVQKALEQWTSRALDSPPQER
jgi:hypothetical protein